MRQLLLGLVATAAIATPLAVAGSANAATTCRTCRPRPARRRSTPPSPPAAAATGTTRSSVNVASDGGFTGTNVITGLDAGQMVTVNETVSGQITDKNNDGVKEVTVAGVRDSGFYTFQWSVTDAPMDGKIDSMTDGTVAYVSAQNWNGGPLPITFTAPEFDTRPRRSAPPRRTRWSTRTTTASTSPVPRTLASRARTWPRSPRT